MRRRPALRDYMDVRDVDELPNGTASIIELQMSDGVLRRATVDENGFLRSLDEDRAYFNRSKWTPVERD